MPISMTGFGSAVLKTQIGRINVEIQSVNRKYLEISIVLPKELSRYELELRKWVGESISRGHVTLRLFFTPSEKLLEKLLPDAEMIKHLKKAWVKLAKSCGLNPKDINLAFLLERLPPIGMEIGSDQKLTQELRGCIDLAIEGLLEMKSREGQAIAGDIGSRLTVLENILVNIEKQAPEAVAKLREKLVSRFREIFVPSAELDDRLLREIALFAEKVDIAEEITRFHSHIAQFRGSLASDVQQIGRKLDFLVQEMGREINTIGSKSADAAISRWTIEVKSELEKIREQIQNIE